MLNLQRRFKELNAKYFCNRLPQDTVVDWHYDLPHNRMAATHLHGLTLCNQIPKSYNHGKCNDKHLILIHTDLFVMEFVAEMSLLHEMVHLDAVNGNSALMDHGPTFNNAMCLLALKGSFDGLW